MFEKYKAEVKEKWGQTDAYKQHSKKTKNYSKETWNSLIEQMNDIFAKFSKCKNDGKEPAFPEVQNLVKILQDHISGNYYTCTNEILADLGQMYVLDERFKKNIDKNADGTAEFVYEAIKLYTENIPFAEDENAKN